MNHSIDLSQMGAFSHVKGHIMHYKCLTFGQNNNTQFGQNFGTLTT